MATPTTTLQNGNSVLLTRDASQEELLTTILMLIKKLIALKRSPKC